MGPEPFLFCEATQVGIKRTAAPARDIFPTAEVPSESGVDAPAPF